MSETSFNPHTHEGCDPGTTSSSCSTCSFNPHTHEGCDWLKIEESDKPHVSIHTPTKGVTYQIHFVSETKKFQSTHPRRVWLVDLLSQVLQTEFQSTHPRRVWQSISSSNNFTYSFNPHTHEGCDNELYNANMQSLMFQSTHPRRVWHPLLRDSLLSKLVSIHTPTKGVTKLTLTTLSCLLFQSTHPRRVWPNASWLSSKAAWFQSTHPRRVWLS